MLSQPNKLCRPSAILKRLESSAASVCETAIFLSVDTQQRNIVWQINNKTIFVRGCLAEYMCWKKTTEFSAGACTQP